MTASRITQSLAIRILTGEPSAAVTIARATRKRPWTGNSAAGLQPISRHRHDGARSARLMLRDDLPVAQGDEEGAEHLLAVDALREARPPRLDRARHIVEAAIEDEVGEVPRYELLVGCVEQTIFRGDLTPQVGLVGHVGKEWHRDWLGDLHFEHTGDARPHVLPTELVAVRDIEDFVARSRSDTGPNGRHCQKVCGTDLIESAIGLGRAGEAQWNPKLLGDCRIDGNRHAQIHWVAGGVTDDRLGAQSRPMPRLSDLLAPEKILLII